jgi:hypothetical protein
MHLLPASIYNQKKPFWHLESQKEKDPKPERNPVHGSKDPGPDSYKNVTDPEQGFVK